MAVDSSLYVSLSSATGSLPSNGTGSQYWWATTGRDLANMLRVAKYPERTQRAFLSYYKDFLCPLLGDAVNQGDERQMKSWTWDGSTHEYSFELKGSTKTLDVRFVADFGQLRPVDWRNPLSSANTEAAIASLASRAPDFDETWYRALKEHLDCSDAPVPAQKALIAEAGHMSPILVGFDISRDMPADTGKLPVMGKAYFLPCIAAAAQKRTRFEIVCAAIRQLPDISARPNILSSLNLLEEYLASKPKDWENGARYLATDFVSPDKARLKIYLRCPDNSFDGIWDYFTLGGRIPGMDNAKDQYREFVGLLGDGASEGRATSSLESPNGKIETGNRRKLTTVYFSLDDKHPFPAPKVAFCARNFAANDALVARGLDRWLSNYGWNDGERSIEEHVGDVM
ncbi:aromatic prenyltransferase [Hypoxylon sp. FL0543]|nr:aromatic prenyltransferase [Hypoxylon sp. FL0543]